MARKLPVLPQILGPEAVAAIVYGEISSSLYFALGVVALYALGLTPIVLLLAGILFGLAAGAYAEGVIAVDAPGGSSAVARRAFGDLAGFIVGWAVILDLAVVVALSLLFVPHYAFAAVGHLGELDSPQDAVVAGALVVVLAAIRLVRRTRLYLASAIVAAIDLLVQVALAVLGLVVAFDIDAITRPLDVGHAPTWNAVAYSIPLAMVAFAGLEIVANLLRETKHPSQAIARDTVLAVVGTVVVYAILAVVALSALPVERAPGTPNGAASAISTEWINAPLAGVAQAVGDEVSPALGDVLRFVVGISGVLVLLLSATTAFGGASRVLRSLGEVEALPAVFAQTRRQSLTSPAAVVFFGATVLVVLPVAALFDQGVAGLVSIYAFGILVAFMAVFASVIWLRFAEPDLPRPLRARPNVLVGRTPVPVTAVIGLGLAWLSFVLVLGTHTAARIVPPLWLVFGIAMFVVVRRRRGRPVFARSEPAMKAPVEVAEVPYGTIVVPVKAAGPIEEEMLATAAKLAQDQNARVIALKVIEIPLKSTLDCAMPEEEAQVARLEELAASFARDYNVEVVTMERRARAISSEVARVAKAEDAGLILLGALARPGAIAGRAQVFSETVENILRRAPCRVIVTAFPTRDLVSVADDEEPEPARAPHSRA